MVLIQQAEEVETAHKPIEETNERETEGYETASEFDDEGQGEGVDSGEEQFLPLKNDSYEDALNDEQLRQRSLDQANNAKAEGNKLFGAGKYEDALLQYELALNFILDNPSSVGVRSISHANRAACFAKLGKHEDTIKECTKAVELNPTYIKALVRRGEAYEKLEHFEEAILDMKKIVELDPSNDQARKSMRRLEPLAAEKRERMKEEMIDHLAQFSAPSSQFTVQLSQISVRPESNVKKTRGTNFTVEEDILLVSAWLNINLDSGQWNEQRQKAYWFRMWEYFHKYKNFASDRSEKSLMQRWSQIQIATNKFCGCLKQIESRQQSGVDEQDKIANAKLLYQELNKDKPPFQFGHCWNILRNQAKWLEDRQKKIPTKRYKTATSPFAVSSPSTPRTLIDVQKYTVSNTSFAESEGPVERNAEKDSLDKPKSKDRLNNSMGEENVSNACFVHVERPSRKKDGNHHIHSQKSKTCVTNPVEVDIILNASFIDLERSAGNKAQKDGLYKQKSKDSANDSVGEDNVSDASFVNLERQPGRHPEKDGLNKRKSNDLVTDAVGEDNVTNASFVELERPLGRKAKKDRLNKRKSKDRVNDSPNLSVVAFLHEMREEKKQLSAKKMEMYERTYLQQQEKLALEKEKHRLEQMKEDERIMLIDTKGMPPLLADYYQRRQLEILTRVCSSS